MYITKREGNEAPQQLSYIRKFGCKAYTLAFDIQESQSETKESHFSWTEVQFDATPPTYGEIVSAIIRGRYSADDVEAITNNYLLDGSEIHTQEWRAMQQWRKDAKELAKSVLSLME